MATINSHEASPSTSPRSYAAYLTFRGEDIRHRFTDHLFRALMREGLRTVRDGLEREDTMSELQKAIEQARVSIIVFSKNYAPSRWCLEQLVKFLKCRSSGHLVLPVFYDVDPPEVMTQTGSFKEAFMWHERRIGMKMGEQKEYLKGKVQEWRTALKEVPNLSGFRLSPKISEPDESHIIQRVRVTVIEIVTTNNRAHRDRLDRREFCASRREDERTRGKRSRNEISSHACNLDTLQKHFGSKRKDAADSLGFSVSTLKRICRNLGILRWPNRIRSSVSGLPNPYGEKNPLPTFNTLSNNGQITMENDVGGQNLEPNACRPDYFEDPSFQNTRIGSISEFGKTPTFYDSLPGHCCDAEFCFSAVYGETEAAGGASEWVFQPEGQTTQSTVYPNSNALVFPQPHLASEEMLNENGGSSEDRRDSLASQAEASFEEADVPQPSPEEVIETASRLFSERVNVPPTDDLTAHFQAHDAAMASVNLFSAEFFPDLQDDLQDDYLISLGTLQVGDVAGDVGEGTSLLAGGSSSQQQVEASTSRGGTVADDESDVQVVEPPAIDEVKKLTNEAFFGYYGFPRDAVATPFLSFVRDRFPYSFFKVRDLYSQTMGRMQLDCLYTFLQRIKGIRVCDLDYHQIEEIGLTVQNFDKLGFDIGWVYKELKAAKIMRENEQLQRNCEGAKAALDQARAELVKAQRVMAAAEMVVEQRRQAHEHMVEETRLGDRLVDVPLCDTDHFLKKIFG